MSLSKGVLLGLIALAPLLMHAEERCPAGFPGDFTPDVGDRLTAPAGFDSLQATTQFLNNGTPIGASQGANGVGIDDPPVLAALRAHDTLQLQWKSGSHTCTVNVRLAAAVPAPTPAAASTDAAGADDLTACADAANQYERDIRERPYALVLFCGNGTALQYSSRPRNVIAVGDPIYIGVYTNPNHTGIKFEWPDCAPRDGMPVRYGSTGFNSLPQLTGAAVDRIVPEKPSVNRRCFNASVQIILTSGSSDPRSVPPLNQTYTVRQYELYNYSFQLGAAFTDDVSHDFAITPDSTGTSRIRDGGPTGRGPKYFAALTVYGLPWQICSAFKGCGSKSPYLGRDLVNDTGPLDRISGVFGVGLEHPQDEFEAGIAFELFPGINATGLYRLAKIDVLDGVAVGDAFTGSAADLPKQAKWQGGFVFGLAFDLNYVTSWFGRK